MEDRYGNHYYRGGSGLWRSLRDGDFEESEVWDVLRDETRHSSADGAEEPSALKHTPSSAKPIPRSSAAADCGSSTPRSMFSHQSAPVNIPNWTHVGRIGQSKSSKLTSSSMHEARQRDDYEKGGGGGGGCDGSGCDDDDDGDILPPHEYISMRLSRRNISSFSVLEGVGRKLKGRDLCKVRNHVLTKTGFLESPPN